MRICHFKNMWRVIKVIKAVAKVKAINKSALGDRIKNIANKLI
jgi:hypothetical protein